MPSVIVVGAGVVGATIARELVAAGARVRVLDARTPGDGATRASAGLLAPYIEGHPASPLRDFGRQSLDLYDDFILSLRRESRRDIVYARSGTLEIALSDEEAERLSGTSGTLWREGVEARWVPPSVIPDLEPNVTTAAKGGLFIPQHGFVGVASLTSAAMAAAEDGGAEVLVETGALSLRARHGGGVQVSTASDVWEADQCVMAAGSWSARITIEGADPVPVTPIRGQLLQLTAPRGLLTRAVWGTAGYLVPWPDGSILAGATVEDVGFDERTTQEARRALMDMAVALVPPLENASIADVRSGLRPRGPDDLPVIGRSAAVPGLIYATGHYRNGVLLAPFTADLVRRLVFDASASAPPALDPARCGRL